MRQYTFLNTTKILYGISVTNGIDVTVTVKKYLELNNNAISFEILDSLFKNNWVNCTRRLYVYDQHYIVSPCEITERFDQEFKIILTTGGSVIIKNNQNVKKINNTEKVQPFMQPNVKNNMYKNQTLLLNKDQNISTTLTYTKVKLPIIQLLKNSIRKDTSDKLCFLFMVYNKLNKPDIWDAFFSNADPSKYSIFVHSKYDIIDENSKILQNNLIDERYETEWGTWSLVEVQNKLLEIGLKDPLNKKFLFLSDSHVPLHDFETVYGCTIYNDLSFIDIIGKLTQNNINTINDVFNIGKQNMLKMSQWSCLNRKHAEMLLEKKNEMKSQSQFSIIPDESAYICTLTGIYFPKKIENMYNKNLTFVDWITPSTNKMNRAFPRTYEGNELQKLLPTLRNDFLFVRKISPSCNIDQSIIQSYSSTINAYPNFLTSQKMGSKIIVSVYCKETKNTSNDGRNFWGFGDMLRGTISIYKLAQELGTSFYLDTLDHPVAKFLKLCPKISGYDGLIKKAKNNIYTFYKYSELQNFVKQNLITSNFVAVHSNSIYKDKNNVINEEHSNFLSKSDKTDLIKYFTPSDELEFAILEQLKKLPPKYNIIHFRIGDDFFDSKIDKTKLEYLENIFLKYYENCDVLLTDNQFFKQYLKNKHGCLTLDTNIVHVGVSTNDNGIKDTLIEWFIQSKSSKIKTYSSYGWISGFVFWTHNLFEIPLINMKKNIK